MQRLKKIFAFCMALSLIVCLFAGCDSEQRIAAMNGPWYTVRIADAEVTQALLQQIDLYEQELALLDGVQLRYCQRADFSIEKTYSFRYDRAVSLPFFRSFFRSVFARLFEGRTALNALYDRDFGQMNQDAFYEFYAQIYAQEDFDALIEYLTQDAAIPGSDALESGTFSLRGDKIRCTDAAGNTKTVGYTLLENGTLVLTYADASEEYRRAIPIP